MILVLSSYSNFDKTFYFGNSFDFGDFDRCLRIEEKVDFDILKGKYCMVQYHSLEENITSSSPSKNKIEILIAETLKLVCL